jgi:hypothetical protein
MSNLNQRSQTPPISPSKRVLRLTPIKAGTAHLRDGAGHDNLAKNWNSTIRPQTGSRRDRPRRYPRRCIPLPSHSWRLGQRSHESAGIDQPDALARVGYCSQRNRFADRSFPLMRPPFSGLWRYPTSTRLISSSSNEPLGRWSHHWRLLVGIRLR